jgi:predicted O-linked N-acetylglucosamine transferase (SPINDLY family)
MNGPIERAWERLNAGDPDAAKAILRQALAKAPGFAAAHKLMGMIHSGLHEDEAAMESLRRCVACEPRDAEAWFMLGNGAMILKRHEEGERAYARCIELAPEATSAYDGRAKCLFSLGRSAEAHALYERTLALTPQEPDVWGRYATALVVIGRARDAVAVVERGLAAVGADNVALLEQLCYTLNFVEGVSPAANRAAHERLGRAWAAKASRFAPEFPSSRGFRDPDRALRVGFMSGDYCKHACAWFLEGPLSAWGRACAGNGAGAGEVEIVLLHTLERRDEVTDRFAAAATMVSLAGLDDAGVAEAVLSNGIDVLIDCAGWTEGSRLRALVPRAAPVQATYLGYPNTTGLPTMDWRIVDALTDPPGTDDACSERLWRLERCFVCFRPHEESPAVAFSERLPDASRPIALASFNRATKLSDECVALWSRVLRETAPSAGFAGTTLTLKASVVNDESRREAGARFAAHGVDPARVNVVPFTDLHTDHLAMYHGVDLALDTLPYNGTTTTCEAMWMGVPVVTRVGDAHRSRVGKSLLECVGMGDLAAPSDDEFVRVVRSLVHDRTRLADLRAGLRRRMGESALCDHAGHARALARACRGMWRDWVAGGTRGDCGHAIPSGGSS